MIQFKFQTAVTEIRAEISDLVLVSVIDGNVGDCIRDGAQNIDWRQDQPPSMSTSSRLERSLCR